MIQFNQNEYIESTKGIFKELFKELLPDTDFPIALPDIGSDEMWLDKPVVFIQYDGSVNVDRKAGKNTGRGTRHKRKTMRFVLMVITTGENSAILQRDRIAQTLEMSFSNPDIINRLAGQGVKDVECRYANDYKVREGVHMARLEFYGTVSIIN